MSLLNGTQLLRSGDPALSLAQQLVQFPAVLLATLRTVAHQAAPGTLAELARILDTGWLDSAAGFADTRRGQRHELRHGDGRLVVAGLAGLDRFADEPVLALAPVVQLATVGAIIDLLAGRAFLELERPWHQGRLHRVARRAYERLCAQLLRPQLMQLTKRCHDAEQRWSECACACANACIFAVREGARRHRQLGLACPLAHLIGGCASSRG